MICRVPWMPSVVGSLIPAGRAECVTTPQDLSLSSFRNIDPAFDGQPALNLLHQTLPPWLMPPCRPPTTITRSKSERWNRCPLTPQIITIDQGFSHDQRLSKHTVQASVPYFNRVLS